MRLLLPSLAVVVYLFISLILPLAVRPWAKALMGAGLLTAGLKYVFYEIFGGSFFKPDLPASVLLPAECLYASLIILFFMAALKDAAGLLLRMSRYVGTSWYLPCTPAVRTSFLLVVSITCGAWGTWQSIRVPDVRTVEITFPDMPQELEGFTIVQLTDLHIGPLLKKEWLNQVVTKTNALSANAIVITGDMIDGSPGELRQEISPLGKLQAQYGVFGITGNHEYYYNAPGWIKEFRSLGIDMLVNTYRVLPGGLVLGGVPDSTAKRFGLTAPDVETAFSGAPEGLRILLSHKPYDLAHGIPAPDVSLQLSGHTHGGLMYFLAPVIGMFNHGYVNGLYVIPQGQLYVSPGTGLWSGFSCRINVPSEITRIILRQK